MGEEVWDVGSMLTRYPESIVADLSNAPKHVFERSELPPLIIPEIPFSRLGEIYTCHRNFALMNVEETSLDSGPGGNEEALSPATQSQLCLNPSPADDSFCSQSRVEKCQNR